MTIQYDSLWGPGQLLAFSGVDGPTAYDTGLCLRSLGPGTALAITLPGTGRIEVSDQPPLACELACDHLELHLADGAVLRGAFLDAHRLLLEGPVRVVVDDDRLVVRQKGARTLIASAVVGGRAGLLEADLDAALAARRWWSEAQIAAHGLADRPAAIKALRQFKGQIYSPEGIFRHRWSTPDRWPHRGCWLWDSAFHAIGARHIDPALARDCIAAVFDGQRADGMVPIRSNPCGADTVAYTQPPTLALATWAMMRSQPDPAWLRGLLPRLEAYLAWDMQHRNGGHGLPCWAIEANPTCRSGESGLDNASRFDAATRMEAVDFASFLALEWELLALLYGQLGNTAAAQRCAQQHASLSDLIRQRLWDETSGLFRDHDLEHGRLCPVAAVTGFLPLICGAASPDQAARLLAHLDDPTTFGTAVLLPSVARNDASYEPDMWRGPVWVNMVHLVAAGCDRYGFTDAAQRLRTSITTEIERWHAVYGTLFEFYDADGSIPPPELHRKGRCAPDVSPFHQCFHDYGWTGTLYLDMVLDHQPLLPRLDLAGC